MKYNLTKKIAILMAVVFTLFPVFSSPVFAMANSSNAATYLKSAVIMYNGSPNAYVSGILVKIDAKNAKLTPTVINKVTYVPLRFICSSLNGKYAMNTKTSTITVTISGRTIVFKLNSSTVTVNKRNVALEAQTKSINENIYVPLKGLASLINSKLFTANGLIVLSGRDKILDSANDAALIDQIISKIKAGTQKKLDLSSGNTAVSLTLEKYTKAGVFTLQKPKGWNIYKAGEYNTIAYYERDGSDPLKQVYCFSEIGLVYTSKQQKTDEYNYVNYMNGYPIAWLDMPVVNPFTPGEYFKNLDNIFESQMAQGFFSQYSMPRMTAMEDLQIISKNEFPGAYSGTTSGLIRALFKSGGKVAEGLFYVTVLPDAYGHGTGYTVSAITAPIDEFKALEPVLLKSFESFRLEDSYVKAGMQAISENGEALAQVSNTISKTGDMIAEGWNGRQKADDALSEKRSDTMLGYDRVYDTETGDVYKVPQGTYDAYIAGSNVANNSLELVPDDRYDLWLQTPSDATGLFSGN